MSKQETDNKRFGFVAVMGEPNAGKSTLINAIAGAKISIVSPKVQTTRTRVCGIMVHDKTQIVFVDTPGLFRPDQKNNLEKAIVSAAWEGMSEADQILLIVDASRRPSKGLEDILNQMKERKPGNLVLVLNKIDKVKRDSLLALAQQLNDLYPFSATFMVSAMKEDGLNALMDYLAAALPEGTWHYDDDAMTDMPMRLMAAEITREKLFIQLYQELPYGLTVETDEWENFDDGSVKIHQTIYTAREAHKKIILGKGASMLKKIGTDARTDLEKIMDCRVHLKLFVKVHENWMDDEERYALWGLNPRA
jgi:GTP-binding protein Era